AGQRQSIATVDQEALARETMSSAVVTLRGPVGIDSPDGIRMHPGDAERGNDVRAGRWRDGRYLGGLGAAIGFDLECRKRGGTSGPGVEADGPTVEEAR